MLKGDIKLSSSAVFYLNKNLAWLGLRVVYRQEANFVMHIHPDIYVNAKICKSLKIVKNKYSEVPTSKAAGCRLLHPVAEVLVHDEVKSVFEVNILITL